MEKVVAAEISFLPLDSDNYNADVKRVLQIIESSGLDYTVGMFATVLRGEKNSILRVIETIYDSMDHRCSFVLEVKLSNACGRE